MVYGGSAVAACARVPRYVSVVVRMDVGRRVVASQAIVSISITMCVSC